ncbi:MAG: class I SAM-dependent methyltransferase [Planctomycetia bacterium]|nr:class I SAM-dependent methyltransferase [Planctomycetia bacterium]
MLEGVRWEHTVCPVCGFAEEDEFLRAPGDDGHEYRLAKCRRCSLVFQNPRPDEATIGLLYTEDYPPYRAPTRKRGGFLRGLKQRLLGHAQRTLIDRIPVRFGATLLDYGCGAGAFAYEMRQHGWNALGMDFSPHAAATARAYYGLRVIEGTLPHPAVPQGSLDAITLRMVLEHIHDPTKLLRAAFEVLKPGGWLYVGVPNLASWGFRAFGSAWFPLRLPWHLLHFTPDTLRRVVTDCGFQIDTITTKGHTKWMSCSVDRARKLSPRWWLPVATLRFPRSVLTNWTQWRNEADDLCLLARKPDTRATELPIHNAA